jgi:DNA-binding transcriptional MocR family regulator
LEYAHIKQLSFLPGSACFPTHVPNQYIRLSYAGVHEEELTEAIQILCHTINTMSTTYNNYSSESYPSF